MFINWYELTCHWTLLNILMNVILIHILLKWKLVSMSVVVVLLYIESCYVYPAWCRCRSRPCHSSNMGLLYSVHCQQNILGKFRLEPQTILNAQQPVTDKILIFNKIKNFHSAYLCTFRPRNNLNTQQAG